MKKSFEGFEIKSFDAEKRIHNKRQPQMTNIGKSRQYTNREKTPK